MGTGLTDFLKIDEVRAEFDTTYPNPGKDVRGELKVENQGYSHRLIGDAFEFLCRLWLYRECEVVVEPWRRFGKARYGADETPEIAVVETRYPSDEAEVAARKAEKFIETGLNTDRAIDAALMSAGWEQIEEEQTHQGLHLDAFEDDLVTELRDLFELLRSQEWPAGDTVWDSPNFGPYPYILEGEGDFIVDELLVDVKTTESGKFSPSFWRQLLGYYLLNDVQRVLYEETDRARQETKPPQLEKVGIYFARYGELKTVDVSEVLTDQDEYEEFRAWVVDRAIEENRDERVNYSDIRACLTEPYNFKRQRTLFDEY